MDPAHLQGAIELGVSCLAPWWLGAIPRPQPFGGFKEVETFEFRLSLWMFFLEPPTGGVGEQRVSLVYRPIIILDGDRELRAHSALCLAVRVGPDADGACANGSGHGAPDTKPTADRPLQESAAVDSSCGLALIGLCL